METLSAQVVTPILASLRRLHPAITIELITDTRSLSLSRREADLALRLAEFEQHETVVRRVRELAFGLYAGRDYIAEHGQPDLAEGSPNQTVVPLQEDLLLLPEAKWLTGLTHRALVAFRSNSRAAHALAAKAGYGIVGLPRHSGDAEPELLRLTTRSPSVVRALWLGVHRDTRLVPRVRAVVDHLVAGLKERAGALNPAE